MMHSLRSQLVLLSISVILASIGTIYLFVNRGVQGEIQQYEQHTQQIYLTRMEHLLSRHYSQQGNWTSVQPLVENMGTLYGQRIILTDSSGTVVADSQGELSDEQFYPDWPKRTLSLQGTDSVLGTVYISPLP